MSRRIYFVSDIHGSERCWRKFLASPAFYDADTIIVGGDITGKFIIPIIRQNGDAVANVFGVERRASGAEERAALARSIADLGAYSFETTADEYAEYQADPQRIDRLFHQLVLERIEEWVSLAEDRLRDSGVRCLVSAGNDDFFEIDEILKRSQAIESHDNTVLDLGEGWQILGLGYANRTPWDCPRDISEEELGARIDTLAAGLERMDRAIFSIHVPPYGTALDMAPRLDADLRPVMGASGPELTPVGSTAVLDAIKRYQPALTVHGHVHESRAVRKIGKTVAVNPGSEYQEGVLNGALIDLDAKKGVRGVQLVSG